MSATAILILTGNAYFKLYYRIGIVKFSKLIKLLSKPDKLIVTVVSFIINVFTKKLVGLG